MFTKQQIFFLLAFMLISLVPAQNVWDTLTNAQLSGNDFNHDKTGYSFNYGNLYPESDLSVSIMNCLQNTDVFNSVTEKSFSTTEFIDSSKTGRGSMKFSFEGKKATTFDVQNDASTFFFTKNCEALSHFVKIETIQKPKVRAMVKTTINCRFTVDLLYLDNNNVPQRILNKGRKYARMKANRWTLVEFQLDSKFLADNNIKEVYGLCYSIVTDEDTPVDLYVDWAEVGNLVGKNTTKPLYKTEYYSPGLAAYLNYSSRTFMAEDQDGYVFNFGTSSGTGIAHHCLEGILYGDYQEGVHNVFHQKGVSTSISNTEYIDSTYANQGSLVYSYDGTQESNGYITSKLWIENCHQTSIDVSNPAHRYIRAMVKTTKDSYFRIFGGGVSKDYQALKYHSKDSLDVFNRPIFLKANEWTEVVFNLQELYNDTTLVVDYSKLHGVTFSVMNDVDEQKATAFPVDFYIDWLEVGSLVGVKKTKSTSSLANNKVSDAVIEYNFSNLDTLHQSFAEVNCLPFDSVGNHLYNITYNKNVRFDVIQHSVNDGSLLLKVSKLPSDWIINKLPQGDCELTKGVKAKSMNFILKPSQTINLKVAAVIQKENGYFINDTLGSVSFVKLLKNEWNNITIDIPTMYHNQEVDLNSVIGLAYQISFPDNKRVNGNSSVSLLIDQIQLENKKTSAIHDSPQTHFYKIYPNPVTNELNIEALPEQSTVFIYTILGELVKESVASTINVSDLSSGIYILKIIQNEQIIYTQKIVK